MLALSLSLLLPTLAGFLCVRPLWPARAGRAGTIGLKSCLALGLGLGMSSGSYFAWLVLVGPPGPGYPVVESAGYLALSAALFLSGWWRRAAKGFEEPVQPPAGGKLQWVLFGLFAAGFAAKLLEFVLASFLFPHGMGDSWFTWNMRARFLYRGGEHWTDAFSNLIGDGVGDYPLLLPANIARGWQYLGRETTAVPALMALLFTFGASALLYSALKVLRGRSQGALAGLAVLTYLYVVLGYAQVADVPLSFYFLATVVLFALHDALAPGDGRLLALAGIMAGCAAWTKNEGLLFVMSIPLARLILVDPVEAASVEVRFRCWRRYGREMLPFLLGLLPAACVLAYFKLRLAPESYLLAGQTRDLILDRIRDVGRYRLIAFALVRELVQIGSGLVLALPFYLLLLGTAPHPMVKSAAASVFLVCTLVLLGYALVYLTTPLDLAGHLGSSLHRLLTHLWPSFLFAFFLTAATPEEALARKRVAEPIV
jgi:hypothetical protein